MSAKKLKQESVKITQVKLSLYELQKLCGVKGKVSWGWIRSAHSGEAMTMFRSELITICFEHDPPTKRRQ